MTFRVLALETSSPVCRIAVLRLDARPRSALDALEAGVAVEHAATSGFARHSDVLYGVLDAALRDARTRVRDLDGIAISAGPGSFTGLRVGLAVAKVLALFGRIPLAGVSTLEAMALEGTRASTAGVLVPTLDARRGDVYAAVYRRAGGGVRKTGGPWVIDPGRLAARVPAGALAVTEPPRAATIAALGAIRLLAGRLDDPARLVPVYLRRPEAVEKRSAERRARRRS
jgi:tRNA threonylcarbamoyladenosine biosynthesis protein TsaB